MFEFAEYRALKFRKIAAGIGIGNVQMVVQEMLYWHGIVDCAMHSAAAVVDLASAGLQLGHEI